MKTRNRTIRIKVAEVIEGGTKQEFYKDLQESLDLARRTANKVVSICVGIDKDLMTGGKCPKLYTYPMVSNEFPGATIIAASICRTVEKKYKLERWQVSTGQKSVCNYRSMPWILLSNKSTKNIMVEDAGQFLTVRIRLLGGWWTVRLAGGSNNREKTKGIRAALEIENGIRDSKIWTDRKHAAIIGISVALPAVESKSSRGSLNVMTSRESLIVATKAKTDVPFVISGDQIQQWASQRDRRYQRLRQDRKSGQSRQAISAVLRRTGDKWKTRVDNYIHVVAKQIVDHAVRRKCSTVNLDMTVKSFMPKFPYFQLAEKLQYKCEDVGIEFLNSTQALKEPDVSKPHVYFKYSPATGRIKIGKTGRADGGRHAIPTDSPDRELTLLAIDNQPKSKLTKREKHHQAQFAHCRIENSEWFDGDRVIQWLREAEWFGNAGNLSQIAQVLPTQ